MNFRHEHDADCYALIVPSDPRSLSLVRGVVESVARLANLDQQAQYEVVLAVNEACSNVIEHAQGGRPEPSIALECRVSADELEFRLRDEGSFFDIEAVPDLDPTQLRKGGRGVFLIRQYMDEVSCSQRADGANELRMLKRIPSASS